MSKSYNNKKIKINSKIYKKLRTLKRDWFTLIIWVILFLIIMETFGIYIHEFGHYSIGESFGCQNLSISIAKLSWKDSISNVSGWESCNNQLVINKEGGRVCNLQTNIITFGGLFLSLILFIPLFLLMNSFFKKKFGKFNLNGKYFIFLLILIVFIAIETAQYDLFKIIECLFNTNISQFVYKIIKLLPIISTLIVISFLYIDFVTVINLINKKSKKENK